MIASALAGLDLANRSAVIENVGNLVCTAGFDLGEHLRIVLLSTAEGDDKAVKYPAIFQGSDALVVTKIDLLQHSDFSVERITGRHEAVGPGGVGLQVSAKTGAGIPPAAAWAGPGCLERKKG